jgi:hypothetical protein
MKNLLSLIGLAAATLALLVMASSVQAAHGNPVALAKLTTDRGAVTVNGGQNGAASATAVNIPTVQVATLKPMAIVSDETSSLFVYPFWISYSDSSALLDIAINLPKPAILEKLFINCASANKATPVSEFELSTPDVPASDAFEAGTGRAPNSRANSPAPARYSNVFWPTSIVEGSSSLVLTSLGIPVQSRLIIEPLAPVNTPVQFCNGGAVFRSLSL